MDHSQTIAPSQTQAGSAIAKQGIVQGTSRFSIATVDTSEDIAEFIERCGSVATNLGLSPNLLRYRVRPKYDGISATYYAHNHSLVTRGDGVTGKDITPILAYGLKSIEFGLPAKQFRRNTAGEIIMPTSYFEGFLAKHFSSANNFLSDALASLPLSELAKQAFKDNAIHFISYEHAPAFRIDANELLENINAYENDVRDNTPYATDGVVVEVDDQQVQQAMEHSRTRHSWQINFAQQAKAKSFSKG